eukprot:CAMPEP_0198236112 /NCGR_PEP_ID=MMETSP1446-20131203/2012_1 /TAXON_ID=1461542 ORGANISM="Unidentified sp, Strain CCMP2111" /NCGR_SAMPLE_ID=MMETSP1446 /ASSEMBLY_ACC=CAM_ASM_001112 /LENGTH=62 /DNA_ID=CAMNT_0043917679 /DNA_START=193 /DNA_END=381 /DNA_ORIENTATION=+
MTARAPTVSITGLFVQFAMSERTWSAHPHSVMSSATASNCSSYCSFVSGKDFCSRCFHMTWR